MTTATLNRNQVRQVVLDGAKILDGPLAKRLDKVIILRDGLSRSSKGEYRLDPAIAGGVVDHFRDRGNNTPIDFEHQSMGGEYARADGRAPAAGWIQALEYIPGRGLVADVQWTEEALAMIKDGQYRYLSPVIIVEKSSRNVVELQSAGLTNLPAIENSPELVANKRRANGVALANSEDSPLQDEEEAAGSRTPLEQLVSVIDRLADALGIDNGDPLKVLKSAIEAAGKVDREIKSNNLVANTVREFLDLGDDADYGVVEDRLILWAGDLRTASSASESLQNRIEALNQTVHEAEKKNRTLAAKQVVYHPDHRGKFTERNLMFEHDRLVNSRSQFEFDERVTEFQERAQRTPVALKQEALPSWSEGHPTGSKRITAIMKAGREFDENPTLKKLTTRVAFINGDLIDAKLDRLTNKEREEYSVAL